MSELNYEKLLQYGLKIVSRKRYTEAEMKAKLELFFKKKGMVGTEVIAKVIGRLEELNYLNDEEYARSYISDRVRFRPKGKFLLKRELTKKGVAKELIEKTIDSLEIDEYEMAMDVLERA
ncbi:MAG: regulatory protein RecX, partial [Candidatus Gracilibacteria bacterium]